MHSSLLFGRGELRLDLPNDITIQEINKHPMPLLDDVGGSIRKALENPIGSLPLAELAGNRKSACILICDITRPVPNGLLLPPLLDTLLARGLRREDILILVATGLHRPNEGEELRELVGNEEVYRSFRIENHFARDREAHVDLGVTYQGIPIGVFTRLI